VNPEPPLIDGVLDDEVWRSSPMSIGLRQIDPDAGEPATERTEIRVVYDDEAIYFGVACYDREPDKIAAPLARRDAYLAGDRLAIHLDPRHDHKNGFFFILGPSGWRADGIIFNDGRQDDTWNGVWEGAASITEKGWSAEFRIPYHVLRFNKRSEYVWGIQVIRNILRKQERARWAWWPKGKPGWNSRFGHLVGIEGIAPRRSFELLPFGLSRASVVPDEDPVGGELSGTAGLDLRYGVTPGISLNATINPDFGQVEADAAELNLGVFETFFEERRSFFLEGNSVYRTSGPGIAGIRGPARLFHSRRIGRRPSRFDKPDETDFVNRPDGTTIIGAANLSGKTMTGTSFGIIEAVMDQEFATIEGEDTGVQSRHLLEPRTNYLVGRVQQDLFENSKIGAFASSVRGSGFDPATVGSVDGELRFRENTVKLFTRWTGSVTHDEGVREKGYEGVFLLGKSGGTFGAEVYADTRSPSFDVNDLGFMDRNDRTQVGRWVNAQIRTPWWFARESSFNFNIWRHWNHDGVTIEKGININMWHDLHNYWWFWIGLNRAFQSENDLITRVGPVVVDPPEWDLAADLGSDSRKAVQINVFWGRTWYHYGASVGWRLGGRIRYRPIPRFTLEVRPRYNRNRNDAKWIKNVDVDDDGLDDHFVFGRLHRDDWDVRTRLTYSFTPDMDVQFWMQQFVVTGDYKSVKELARPHSFEFLPFDGLDENPDFDRRSLRSNFVFR
jgi:hypothetical protein